MMLSLEEARSKMTYTLCCRIAPSHDSLSRPVQEKTSSMLTTVIGVIENSFAASAWDAWIYSR